MCHGGAAAHPWSRNIDALAEHFTVRTLDLPGYGESDPTNKDYTATEYVRRWEMDKLTND